MTMTKKHLLARATELKIKQRSKMTKEQLLDAICAVESANTTDVNVSNVYISQFNRQNEAARRVQRGW